MTCKTTLLCLLCATASALLPAASAQELIAGTSTSPPTFLTNSFHFLTPTLQKGVSFSISPSSAYAVTQLQTAAYHYANLAGNSAVFSINADAMGIPGSELVTFSTNNITTIPQTLTLSPSHPQILLPGIRYWLVGRTGLGQVNWNLGINTFGEVGFSNTGVWDIRPFANTPNFALLGVPVPEPSAWFLAFIGLAATRRRGAAIRAKSAAPAVAGSAIP